MVRLNCISSPSSGCLMLYEGALASFLNSALDFSPTLFLGLPKSSIPCMKFTSPKLYIRPMLIILDRTKK